MTEKIRATVAQFARNKQILWKQWGQYKCLKERLCAAKILMKHGRAINQRA